MLTARAMYLRYLCSVQAIQKFAADLVVLFRMADKFAEHESEQQQQQIS